jgi:hypothetical protein
MPIPYLITTLLYLVLALLSALDASLVSFNFLNVFAALRWMRVHFVTLGVISQALFGFLPNLVALVSNKQRPAMRWDIWLTVNAGVVTLAAGFSGMNPPMIIVGGTLVFIATCLLMMHLWGIRGGEAPVSLKFYLTGAIYLLLGIFIGTGLFLNWSGTFYIQNPLETHIHANAWGFMSLTFAGLMIDFVPLLTGRPLATPKGISYMYWGMTLGAFGLVLGPWLGGSLPPTIAGLILHISATVWLVISLVRAFIASGKLGVPGTWHLISSYIWILTPVMIAPFILLEILPAGPIETTAPQALIYGWSLQFGIALIPYVARKYFLKENNSHLGGSWGSVAAMNAGSVLVWTSIFITPLHGVLYGIGFVLYAFAFVHPLIEMIHIARTGFLRLELNSEV